jgi:M6 family metalloprotease-like protein
MFLKKIGAVLTALAASAQAAAAIPSHAAAKDSAAVYYYEESGYFLGDVNNNYSVDMGDAVLLQQWLLNMDVDSSAHLMRADMEHDDDLDIFDMILLRQTIISGKPSEWIERPYIPPETETSTTETTTETTTTTTVTSTTETTTVTTTAADEDFMDAPITAVKPTVLSQGKNKLVMFVVDFPDCKFKTEYSVDQIRQISFGPENVNSQFYPLESVTAYYNRASYGALDMEADIYKYTAKNNIDTYIPYDSSGTKWADTTKLADEIMSAFDAQIDFSQYDVNSDGTMDTILISAADNASDDGWWPCSGSYGGYRSFDGVIAGNIIIGNTSPSDTEKYNNTWIHELGHAMGLPDYYKYENYDGQSQFGLNGDAGTEMMDDAYGDMSAFSKLMYGWYKPSQIKVYTGGTQTYTLASSQVEGGCILIPCGDLNGYLSEYMLIEYATHEGNNATWWLFNTGGIRVMHCDASVSVGYWGPEFSWNNYAMNYDSSNLGRRVLRLANESEGGSFFTAGSVVDGYVSGFHWYDSSGKETVDVGCRIAVGPLTDGKYTITISDT